MDQKSAKKVKNRPEALNENERLQWRLLDTVFAQNNNATSGGLFAFSIAALTFWQQVPSIVWLVWITGYGLVVFYRSRKIAECASDSDRSAANLEAWRRRVDLIQLATGAMWGVLLTYLVLIGTPEQIVVAVLLMTGLVTGGLLAYSYRQPTYVLFSSGMCLPPTIGLLLRPEPLVLGAALAAAWFLFLWSCSNKFADFYRRALRLSLTNKELVHDLEQRNQEVSDLNRSLHEKIAELGESNSNLKSEQERIAAFARELEKLSTTDPLTHIANRRHLELSLEKAWRRAMRRGHELGLILMDVDHFKNYNDNYGHQQGDQCLVDVARILSAYAPPESCVARYGGEEFVVLLPYTTHFEALEIARNFVTRVAVTGIRHEFSPVAPHLTISAGLSVVRPSPQVRPSQLLQNADKALYQAKRDGRNQVVSDRTAGVLDSDDKPVIELDDVWQTGATPPESSVVASTPRESASS